MTAASSDWLLDRIDAAENASAFVNDDVVNTYAELREGSLGPSSVSNPRCGPWNGRVARSGLPLTETVAMLFALIQRGAILATDERGARTARRVSRYSGGRAAADRATR